MRFYFSLKIIDIYSVQMEVFNVCNSELFKKKKLETLRRLLSTLKSSKQHVFFSFYENKIVHLANSVSALIF